ncbi:trypsin alpha-3-like protein, partial [Leptotrombidium deliense]
CGIQSPSRIIGGSPVDTISRYPFMAMLVFSGEQQCGGSIIASKAILTAAHCMDGETIDSTKVGIGLLNRSQANSAQLYDVAEIVIHPNYTKAKYYNDISILILEKEIDLNQYPPICLPSPKRQCYNDLTVIGWGYTEPDGDYSEQLLEVEVPENNFDDCNAKWENDLCLKKQLCAGDVGKDSCQADSGGPLFRIINGRYTQAGIVSFGDSCSKKYGVYSRVSGFRNFIDDVIAKHGGGYMCEE